MCRDHTATHTLFKTPTAKVKHHSKHLSPEKVKHQTQNTYLLQRSNTALKTTISRKGQTLHSKHLSLAKVKHSTKNSVIPDLIHIWSISQSTTSPTTVCIAFQKANKCLMSDCQPYKASQYVCSLIMSIIMVYKSVLWNWKLRVTQKLSFQEDTWVPNVPELLLRVCLKQVESVSGRISKCNNNAK